jgi:hypothetical protein
MTPEHAVLLVSGAIVLAWVVWYPNPFYRKGNFRKTWLVGRELRKRVYVMAPFRAKTEMQRQRNITAAKEVGVMLASMGFAPVVPHTAVAFYYDELPEQEMMDICLSLLAGCDYCYLIARSEGVDQEIAFSKEQEIPLFQTILGLQSFDRARQSEV